MCEDEATSAEHVPPKCLFPEAKDVKGYNFRKNLITVPSCALHNLSKSSDDEFLMFSLAGLLDNNSVGHLHFFTKVNRAARRKEKDFIVKQILRNHKFESLKTIDDKVTIASIGEPNYERLLSCFDSICKGIYYHEFGGKFCGDVRFFFGFLEYKDPTTQTLKKFIKKRYEAEPELLLEIKGDNKSVFYYQFVKPDKDGLIALKLVFYGRAEVFVSYKPTESPEPFDLTFALLQGGVKTIIKLGDENFEFN